MKNVKWFKISDATKKRQLRFNLRTVGYDEDSGEVLLCADAFGGEMRNLICMTFDGIRLVYAYGRLFCPASWLKNEFPALAGDIEVIVGKVIQFAACDHEHP